MKKFYLSVLLILITMGVLGQSGISFNDTLRPFGSGGDGFAKVIEDSNSYYALSFLNSTVGQYPYLLELDNYGSILNEKMYIDTNYNYAIYPYNSMVLKDSVLLFCGQTWNDSIGNLGFVFAINKYTLDTLWTKTYTHPDTLIAQTAQDVFSVLTAIKPAPDGGYILTGNYNKDCITGNLRSFLMKIDSVGNVEWRKTYDDVTGLFDIELTKDGGGVFLNPYGNNVNRVARFDSTGIITWQIQVNTGMTGWSNTSGIRASKNNTVVGVRTYMYNNNISHPYMGFNVFKVDINTKQVLWDKTYRVYKNVQCISMHQAIGVETLPNGDIIVSGTAKNYGYDAVILKLNSNGDSLWCKSYDFDPDPWDCQLNDLIITEDGGFMGVGFFSDQSGPGWTAWMFKTDANGTIGWEEITRTENKYFAKLYPNPSHDYTTLKYDCSYSNLTYIIMDVTGREVKTDVLKTIEDLSFNEILIDLSGLSPGTYYFVVKANKESLFSEKLIITE